MADPGTADNNTLVDRAIRLFKFLTRLEQQRTRVVHTADEFEASTPTGRVLWFHDVPDEQEVAAGHRLDTEPDAPWLVLDRPPKQQPPDPPHPLPHWVNLESIRDPDQQPTLRERRVVEVEIEAGEQEDDPGGQPDGPQPAPRTRTEVEQLDDHPEVTEAFDRYLTDWQAWAEEERRRRPVRKLYGDLFKIHQQVTGNPEQVELILGVGCLGWNPDEHPAVLRHLIEQPAVIRFDDETGRITVQASETSGPAHELEMLEQSLWPNRSQRQELDTLLEQFDGKLLDADDIDGILKRWANILDPDGQYSATSEPPPRRDTPVVTFAPALILRKRTNRSLLRLFGQIIDDLQSGKDLPEGVLQLVHVPDDAQPDDGGADQDSGGEEDTERYLPLAANDEQLQIIDRAGSRSHVVVQGPPGTGKTHTIANLMAHLLASGKRVLVTAHTDRALHELRDKLPRRAGEDEDLGLDSLCVSVVGRERDNLRDLMVAANELARKADNHDPQRTEAKIRKCREDLDRIRRDRSEVYSDLINVRERETIDRTRGNYHGTLAQIAEQLVDEKDRHGWLVEFEPDVESSDPPLDNTEASRLFDLLVAHSPEDEQQARRQLPDLDEIPDPDEFADLVDAEADAAAASATHSDARTHDVYERAAALELDQQRDLRDRFRKILDATTQASQRREAWIDDALDDLLVGKPHTWVTRHHKLAARLEKIDQHLQRLGHTRVEILTEVPTRRLLEQANELRSHLADGGSFRTGWFAPRSVKQAEDLIDGVRVDSKEPNTVELVDRFIDYAEATHHLDEAEKLWPANIEIPEEDTPDERAGWLHAETDVLGRILDINDLLQETRQLLNNLELPPPSWHDPDEIQTLITILDASIAAERARLAAGPLRELEQQCERMGRWAEPVAEVETFADAVNDRDVDSYVQVHRRFDHLHQVRADLEERRQLLERLRHAGAETLADTLQSGINEADGWHRRLQTFEQAWRWVDTLRWVEVQADLDYEELLAETDALDAEEREVLTELTARLAWTQAVDRLGSAEQQALKAYAMAVKRVGKGTGKYAPHHKKEARQALQRCRAAVPAWIMPIYQIADTLDVTQNAFDVVVIDEASQAGVEASFLQYLAPKIIVVGDDKQVSPSGVGINHSELIGLRQQYIDDIPHAHIFDNPKTSFFDQAKLRFGDVITLREHFRCMPEIIGFSNRICYEPENVPLIPLRQYGTDRLDPIRTHYIEDGYEKGSRNKINPPEIDAVVEQVLKCCADPNYDDKTIGVISLTGSAQADAIEQRLLDELDPKEIAARELRCGDASDFQGSERDVMFLSMVAAPRKDSRLMPLVHDRYVQRFNVAASRAKDQMWLFHSLRPGELTNPDGMRYQLLNYCLRVEKDLDDSAENELPPSVPNDRQVPPFDSVFEQHVYNRIRDRGYHVIPQYQVHGYSIDLVVVGGTGRLAVECDGDRWHGPDRFRHDVGRQRDLERCGWEFFRVRASTFYRNRAEALEPLWAQLAEMDIHPIGHEPTESRQQTEGQVDEAEPTAAEQTPTPQPSPEEVLTAKREDPEGGLALEEADPLSESHPNDRETQPDEPGFDLPDELREYVQAAEVEPDVDGPTQHEESASLQPEHTREALRRENQQQPHEAVSAQTDAATETEEDTDPKAGEESGSGPYGLQPYETWDPHDFGDLLEATTDEVIRGLREIVDVEGPIRSERAYQLLANACGIQRIRRRTRSKLNSAAAQAARTRRLVAVDPWDKAGQIHKTLHMPDSPPVVLRERGPRTLYEIPPEEIAALMRKITARERPKSEEELFRQVLDVYDLQRLTKKAREYLKKCRPS